MVKKIDSLTSIRYDDQTKTTNQSLLETLKKALPSTLTTTITFVSQCILKCTHYFCSTNTNKSVSTVYPRKVVEVKNNLQVSEDILSQFWKRHIRSFTIFHATASLFSTHFEKYGISDTYPKELLVLVPKMRAIWRNHQHDVTQKTSSFQDFEKWYDETVLRGRIEMTFSTQKARIQEFTTGPGKGGGWIREIRHFLSKSEGKEKVFTFEEYKILRQIRFLISMIDDFPSMIVKIRGGSSAFKYARGLWSSNILSCSLKEFIALVKQESIKWKNIGELSPYLNQIKLDLEGEKKRLEINDIVLCGPVQPEDLEFEYRPLWS